ncbi:hypothetical protein [Variovorax paradoxus]|uniref:hypothetical protein n=1 Tax=Variovorax paradoxus TaxID=34073 RepID=UPI0029C75ADC|nr:hypothetical protein RZE77_29555 [Variovorax paradoxus]
MELEGGALSNITLVLPLQNESSNSLKVYLEPMPEYFILKPGQKVEIYAIFDEQTKNTNFTIAPNDDFLTVYMPGEISGYVDSFVMCNGIRLIPDGN